MQNSGSKTITVDTPCINCNYNVKNLPLSARCPECQTPVAQSGQGYALRHADVKWLKRVCFGLSLCVWGIPLVIADVVLMAVLVLIVGGVPGGWWRQPLFGSGWPVLALWIAWHCWWLYGVVAVFLSTTREPRTRFDEPLLSPRRCLRVAAVLLPAMMVLFGVASRLPWITWVHSGWVAAALSVFRAGVVVLVGLYLRDLADRTSDRQLRGRSICVTLGLASVILLRTMLSTLADATGVDVTDVPSVLSVVYTVASCVWCALLCMFVGVLVRYRREFAKAKGYR